MNFDIGEYNQNLVGFSFGQNKIIVNDAIHKKHRGLP
jgi:hypothetical protein